MNIRWDEARQVLKESGFFNKWAPYSSRALTIYGVALSVFIGIAVAELGCRDHHIEPLSPLGIALKGIGGFIGLSVALYQLGKIKELDQSHAQHEVKLEKWVNLLDGYYSKGSNQLMSSDHVSELKGFTADAGFAQKRLGLI